VRNKFCTRFLSNLLKLQYFMRNLNYSCVDLVFHDLMCRIQYYLKCHWKHSLFHLEIYYMAARPGLVIEGFILVKDITLWVFGRIELSLAQKKARKSVSYKDG
jgi:hypothetical protein